MPTPLVYRASFAWNEFYHLLFRSNDGSLLFRNDRNRLFFMQRFASFLLPFLDCWAWNLLDNHTHFITRIKTDADIRTAISDYPKQQQTGGMLKYLDNLASLPLLNDLLLRQINSFESSYCLSFNKVDRRRGSLFQKPFRRSWITGDNHLQQAIIYVHANAQKHRLCRDFRQYPYSSYPAIIEDNSAWVNAKDVLQFFGGKRKFQSMHAGQAGIFYRFDFESD